MLLLLRPLVPARQLPKRLWPERLKRPRVLLLPRRRVGRLLVLRPAFEQTLCAHESIVKHESHESGQDKEGWVLHLYV